jgi:precorrin-2 dehydrogenase/sirohydrochlorin ferrochelatase
MRTYPIMLDVRGRLVVVIGGGPVGLRKARSLRDAGARVRLVEPRVVDNGALDGVEVLAAPYRREAIEGAMLVLACTDDRALNSRIARDAAEQGALVNVADTPEECDFYLPATVSAGRVVLAVGTSGAAPALASWLKRRLAAQLPERIGAFAEAIDALRTELRGDVADGELRMSVMKRLVCEEAYDDFCRRGPDALRERLGALLDAPEET